MKNKWKLFLSIVAIVIIGLLTAACSNPAGDNDPTYSIDYYSISYETYSYLMDNPITSEDSLVYILAQNLTEWLVGEDGKIVDEITEQLLDLNFTRDKVDPWMQDLRRYGVKSIWYRTVDQEYRFFYFAEE